MLPGFRFISICMEYVIPSFHFQFVYVFRSELQAACIWVLFLYPFNHSVCFGVFSSFTFKVIIDRYILMAFFVIVFCLFFVVLLLLSSLVILSIFGVMFGFLSLYFLCIYCRFLVCGYHEVHIKQPVHISVSFKLIIS